MPFVDFYEYDTGIDRWIYISFAVFVVVELVLAAWIRDGLLLNLLMLIHPIEAVKQWQMAGAP